MVAEGPQSLVTTPTVFMIPQLLLATLVVGKAHEEEPPASICFSAALALRLDSFEFAFKALLISFAVGFFFLCELAPALTGIST